MTRLTHVDDAGRAQMVDVSPKDATLRSATSKAVVMMQRSTMSLIMSGKSAKGDVLAAARIAGIMAAKKTSDLIPLCHPLQITRAAVEFDLSEDHIEVSATVSCLGQTGVEMEAMTACAVACLTIYDMLKAADRAMRIVDLRLVQKSGGKSGDYSSE
jgi:cyclic pyranopterin monophosphate synthase